MKDPGNELLLQGESWCWSLLELNGLSPGGGLPYKTDEDSRQKIKITPLKETNVCVAQA